MRDPDAESLLEFPCAFPIKAMGLADDELELLVVSIVRRHVPDLGEGAVKTRASGKGKYIAVTVTINATSQQQIDAVYRDLSAEDAIMLAL